MYNGVIHLSTGTQDYKKYKMYIPCDVVWTYDPKTGSFSKKSVSGVMPKKRKSSCIGVIKEKVLLFGGIGIEQMNDIYEQDLNTFMCLNS